MKKFQFLLFSTVLAVGFLNANAQKANFTGTWTFMKSDTNIVVPSKVTIELKMNSLRLIRIFSDDGRADETYLSDGTPVDTLMTGYKKSSFLKWSDDGNKFVITSVYNMTPAGRAPWQYTRTEKYTLSSDQKTMTIDHSSELPDRTETIKAVYNKI